MKFIETDKRPYDSTVLYWESVGGRWQLSLDQFAYGRRVHLGPTHMPVYSTDYCAGGDVWWQQAVFHAVRLLAERMPESIAIHELERVFPQQSVKPMNLDMPCFERLLRLAVEPALLAAYESSP